jgi:hypothetical protein
MTMNVTETIIDNVLRGLVLDAKGKWVPLSQMIGVEYNVLKHLEAGEVLCQGQWLGIKKCKEQMTAGQPEDTLAAASSNEVEHISQKKPTPWIVVSCNSGEQHLAHDKYMQIIRQATSAEKHFEG